MKYTRELISDVYYRFKYTIVGELTEKGECTVKMGFFIGLLASKNRVYVRLRVNGCNILK